MVGWNYATKSYNLHIYYKSKNSDAVPIHTDKEEEFKVLERIAKRYLKSQYFLVPFLIFISWLVFGSIFNNIGPMKDGLIQIIALALPAGMVMSITHIIDLRKFLKKIVKILRKERAYILIRQVNGFINSAILSFIWWHSR